MLKYQKLEFRHRRRARRTRKHVFGTAERPRLSVSRSLANMHVQVIDDSKGHTLAHASTTEKEFKDKLKYGGNKKAAAALGLVIAQRAKEKGVTKVVFDRGGWAYHGRVKEIAEAARKGGLQF